MKNEEKALKLAGLKEISEEERYYQSSKCEIYDKCLEMAQWKDEQFSKFLLWLDDYYVIRKFDNGEPMTYAELIDEFKNMCK